MVVGYGIAGTATQGTDYTVGGGATGGVGLSFPTSIPACSSDA